MPRPYGLLHLEQALDDNLHTSRGQATHRQLDDPGFGVRCDQIGYAFLGGQPAPASSRIIRKDFHSPPPWTSPPSSSSA